MSEQSYGIKSVISRRRQTTSNDIIIPHINSIKDLISIAQTGIVYPHIDTQMLWRICPQLIEIDSMIGMESLKESIFYHIIYYLQNLYIDGEKDYLHTVITGGAGTGKCLGGNVDVRMYDGSIKMSQDLCVGDILIGDDNKPRHITSICNGNDMMYKVTHPEGSYTCNSVHIMSLIDKQLDECLDIPLNEYLSNIDTFSTFTGYRVPFRPDIQIPWKYDIHPYIYGYLYDSIEMKKQHVINGVDYMLCSISLTTKDVVKKIESIQPSHIDDNEFEWSHDIYYNLLVPIDVFNTINSNKFPLELHEYSYDNILHFYNGFMDSHANTYSDKELIVKLDEDSFKEFQNLLTILCIKYRTETASYTLFDDKKDTLYSIYIDTDDKGNNIVSSPFTITPLQYNEYYGFELSGSNGRFQLANGIITHNTTIAKIIGEMYKNMRVLSPDGVFKVATREDFIAEYLGQTAIKTKKLLESCIGGVLFIDEVYALGSGTKDSDSFSKEAIDTINVFLSEHNDSFCCIIAGYEDDIKRCFFDVNQGLRRRFQWVHKIKEYSSYDLAQIFMKILNEIKWMIDENITLRMLSELIEDNKGLFTSYGGDIENLITKCKMTHAKRLINNTSAQKHVITLHDIHKALELMQPNNLEHEVKDTSCIMMYI